MQVHIGDNMQNCTSVSIFLLQKFSEVQALQILYSFLFLALYLMTVSGNLLLVFAITFDHHLHTPMYFFIINLAVLDLGSISVIVPKTVANSLMNSWSISFSGCVAQVFFYFFFAIANFSVLTIMAHDRYVAICNPLQYEKIMHKGACIQMVISAGVASMFYAALHSGGTFAFSFCSNIVNQFFCEVPQLMKLSCSGFNLVEIGFLALGYICGLGCFIFIVFTYMHIFTAVLKIPSVQSKKKALSTCLPHLLVVSLLLFCGMFQYARPPTNTFSDTDIMVSVIYTIIPPLLNPFIYSMRNKEIKNALRKLLDFSKMMSREVLM